MFIGKIWDAASQKYFWSEGDDWDSLIQNLRNEIADYGGDYEFDPAKIEIWEAIPKKIRAMYIVE